eukprot:361435-Pyramimonas_sp.AAC.1
MPEEGIPLSRRCTYHKNGKQLLPLIRFNFTWCNHVVLDPMRVAKAKLLGAVQNTLQSASLARN